MWTQMGGGSKERRKARSTRAMAAGTGRATAAGEQEQNLGQEQSKQRKRVRFGEEQLGETQADNTDELEVTDGLAEVRTGRGCAGLVRG